MINLSLIKSSIYLILTLSTCYLLLFTYPTLNSQTFAQQCSQGNSADGLISAQSITGFGNTSQICVRDQQAAYAIFQIPNFDNLRFNYYTKAAPNKKELLNRANIATPLTDQKIYFREGDLDVNGFTDNTGTGVFVVFVTGNLNIRGNIVYPNGGIVFIVKGDINIDIAPNASSGVTRVDSILIAEGTICTAYEAGSCPRVNRLSLPLEVNGSLISLNKNSPIPPIQFKRTLANNSSGNPSERITQQPKYLVILKDIFSSDLEIRNEL